MQGVIDIETCGTGYWIISSVQIPLAIIFTVGILYGRKCPTKNTAATHQVLQRCPFFLKSWSGATTCLYLSFLFCSWYKGKWRRMRNKNQGIRKARFSHNRTLSWGSGRCFWNWRWYAYKPTSSPNRNAAWSKFPFCFP